MTEMNALIDNLSLLSYENVRKLFYILISLNFFPDTVRATQAQLAQKRDGEKFIKQLHHYLTSSVFREIVWGVIGLIQYVKVILLKDRNGDNNERISNILKKIKDAVSTVGRGKVRAEFYIQLSELLKPMKVLGECEALITFGNELKDIVEKEIYNQKGSRLPHGASPCTYDSETYIDVSVNTWINLAGFVIKDNNELTDNICWLLPLIQLVKDFASYQFSFADESDPLKAQFWESFKFILEANVDLNAVSRLSDSTATNDKIRHCHVLYTVIEYVRTVLNMFADCIFEKEKVHLWMTKKLKLMILCQSHLNQKIGNLGTYTLPRITQINKDQLLVKGKKDAKKKKPKKDKQKITIAAAPVDESMEVDESRDESGIDNSESNASQSNASGLAHKFHAFKLRKEETLKKIALEQF
uniref:FANCI solenoid 4 domain-containing protein n=1 Tax=Panagrolaimus sp. ES5 TaxID=591445 RepID=A0AC34G7Y6_9BILA